MNSPSQPDPWIGRLIGDVRQDPATGYRQRYRLDKRLGTGGMGHVFLAMDTLLGQHVALKLLKDTLVASDKLRRRFEREVALCAALKSDHIVEVSDYGVTPEGHPFYVMEYLRGQSLGQLLQQQLRLSVSRTVSIMTQVCAGLHLAHQGVTLWRDGATVSEHVLVIHRDLKPDNIFLVPTALGELVKILDFGVAKIRNLDSAEHTNLTGMFIGTFRYAAPEQLAAETELDGRADIYSLGIILYELLSGSDPFGFGPKACSTSGVSWAVAHTSKPPQPLRSQPGCEPLSPKLEAVVMQCLQKAPHDRFASVDELNRVLKAAVESSTIGTTIPQPPLQARLGTEKGVLDTSITHIPIPPVSRQEVSDTVSSQQLTPRQGTSEAILSPEHYSLQEMLTELVGPIAPTLLRQVLAQAPSTKELVENLALYLSPNQRVEFEKRAISLLGEYTTLPQTRVENSPSLNSAINASFIEQCERYLTDLIGPIAKFLIQNALKSHPQISPVELVNILAVEIPNSQKAEEFRQHLLKLYQSAYKL